MVVIPFQGKTHVVEPGIEPGNSWLVVRNSDHQATLQYIDRYEKRLEGRTFGLSKEETDITGKRKE